MHSSSSNFFTKCTVAFHFWKTTVHFVFIKKLFSLDRSPPLIFQPNSFSLLSFHPKLSLSSSHFLSVLSALSSLFALSVVGSSVVGLPDLGVVVVNGGGGSSVVGLVGVGLVLQWLGFQISAWWWFFSGLTVGYFWLVAVCLVGCWN